MKHEEELLVNDYYTIGVVFSAESAKQYTYKVDNSIELEVEDLVVILADGQFKIVRVKSVHKEAKIDYAFGGTYKYIVDKVDLTKYNELQERSELIAKTLTESKRRTLQKTMVEQFKDGLDNEELKALEDAGVKGWI